MLVSGAAGVVGSAVVQFARDRGIATIGTASARNHDHLRSLGATPTTYGQDLASGFVGSLLTGWTPRWISPAPGSSPS